MRERKASKETWLVEDGEAEIGGLERGVVVEGVEEEVLGLEVAVDDAEGVAGLDDGDDGAEEAGGLALGEVAFGDDAVEELAALAEVHDEVDGGGVLVGALDANDVGVLGEMVHYLNLTPHVLVVLGAQQFPLGDGLASQLLPRRLVHAQERRPELTFAQSPTQIVHLPHVPCALRKDPAAAPARRRRR